MSEPARAFQTESTVTPIRQPERMLPAERAYESAPVRHAYRILQFGFTVAPIVAGADKFFHFLVNWDQYMAPQVTRVLGISASSFMQGAGVIEIIAGIGVALKPKVFGYIVSGWLCGIIVNLLMKGEYYDIALRDLGLALGAFSLARLSVLFDRQNKAQRVG